MLSNVYKNGDRRLHAINVVNLINYSMYTAVAKGTSILSLLKIVTY